MDRSEILGHFDEDEGDELALEDEIVDRDQLFDKDYAANKHVSELAIGIDRIPEKLLARAQKVFSKHNTKDVRLWAS